MQRIVCHARLNSELDIVTYLAVCASHYWAKVDKIVVGSFISVPLHLLILPVHLQKAAVHLGLGAHRDNCHSNLVLNYVIGDVCIQFPYKYRLQDNMSGTEIIDTRNKNNEAEKNCLNL
jgi:hypothetical protein